MDQLRFVMDKWPDRSPTGIILERFKRAYPKGVAPLSEYTSLFDCLVELRRTRDAKMVYITMRQAGYTTSVSVEARVVVMLLEEFGPEDTAQQQEFTEHLASLVHDANFTERDMHDVLCLAAARDIDRKIMWYAMDAFRSGRGGLDRYIPALDLLPVAVEAAVRRGAVEEAFAMLDAVGIAIKQERAMTVRASRLGTRRDLSIRRDLGVVGFKSRPATQQSLRFAYNSLLTSLRDTGVWKTDVHIVQRALRGLEAVGVDPDTTLLNLTMMQAIHTQHFHTVLPIYEGMRARGLGRGQWPDEHTYDALFAMWEAKLVKPTLEPVFHANAPRPLFRNLLEATDPVYVKNISASASTEATTPPDSKPPPTPLVLSEELLRRILGAFLYQQDYAGAYVALTYMTSEAAGMTIEAWHTVYYLVVRALVQRVFSQPPGPHGRARWAEGFLGTSLRGEGPLFDTGYRSGAGSVGMSGGGQAHRPIGSIRLRLNAQTTNYMLAVIARRRWSITDPMYPPPGELPDDATHLFSPLASSASASASTDSDSTSTSPPKHPTRPDRKKQTGGRSHDFAYSVPSMFMMEHVDAPDVPPGFAWAVAPLQRLLLRALYADEVLAYRATAGLKDRPLEMPPRNVEECVRGVERRLARAREGMLPLPVQRAAVPVWLE